MKNLNILITAGPTREYIDPVRYISNDSSGKMGFALAKAAKKLGADVTLISGPVNLETPNGIKRIDVISAKEMQREVFKSAVNANVIVMVAAVADYRPARIMKQKIKRAGNLSISLIPNSDILAELGKKKRPGQILVGFALETENLKNNAIKKLKNKNCDYIIANPSSVIGKEKGQAIIISAEGDTIKLPVLPKEELAFVIYSYILDLRSEHDTKREKRLTKDTKQEA